MDLDHKQEFNQRRIAVHLKPEAERAIRAGHPWIFEDSILKQSHDGQAGDLAVVFDRKNRFLAIGLYDPHSSIRVRVLQHLQQATIDEKWFGERLSQALNVRSGLASSSTNGFRLVHGENDGFPGLVVDKYDRNIVLKLYSAAWAQHLPMLVRLLLQRFSPERILLRLSRAVERAQGSAPGSALASSPTMSDGQILYGPPLQEPIYFMENGLRFEVDPIHGHKTGFYLDQRENRTRVEEIIAEMGGIERLLDVFAYTGAFSIYSARAGAGEVLSLDVSQPALSTARRNFRENGHITNIAIVKHSYIAGDAFEELRSLSQKRQLFDAVLVDPPAFANKKAQQEAAISAYTRLVNLTLKVLRPGGLLVMSSCSSQVYKSQFYDCVIDSAEKAGRYLVEIARTGHPKDHPISFSQGAYLKCLFAIAP